MKHLRRMMTIPATESQIALALGLSLIMMTGLLWGVLWQSEVISYQRGIIKFLWHYR